MKKLIEQYTPACVELLRELVMTPSVNGVHNEGALAQILQTRGEGLDLPVRLIESEQGRPNVYVGDEEQFSSAGSLLLVAHGDTVPAGDESRWTYPPFGAEIHDGKLYGRGALDCKGGIALGLYVLKILHDMGEPTLTKLLVGADEESGADSQIGIRHVLAQGLNARGAVYTYGGRVSNELTIGHRGVLRVWVTCNGESAHSGSREWQNGEKGASAIEGIMRFLEEVTTYAESIAVTEDEYFRGYRCVVTPTLIEGGSGESLVPESARVLLDIRTLPSQNNEQVVADLEAIADRLTNNKISLYLELKNNVPAVLCDPDDPFVSSVQETMKAVFGYQNVTLKGSGPANEAHMLISKGIPTVVGFGPVGNGFHSVDEFAEVASIEQSLHFLVSLALNSKTRIT